MAGINHVTGEWWWIPGTRGLKRGCPMKDGKIDNKNNKNNKSLALTREVDILTREVEITPRYSVGFLNKENRRVWYQIVQNLVLNVMQTFFSTII